MKLIDHETWVEIVPDKIVKVADLERIARLANRVPLHKGKVERYPELWRLDRTLIQKAHTLLTLDFQGIDADPHDTGCGNDWGGKNNERWFAADLMKLVFDAGFKTEFRSGEFEGWTASAVVWKVDEVETVAMCTAPTECLAAAGLAVWAERETRRAKR